MAASPGVSLFFGAGASPGMAASPGVAAPGGEPARMCAAVQRGTQASGGIAGASAELVVAIIVILLIRCCINKCG